MSAASPFASAGPSLVARGYSPIPITPGDKMPGSFASGEWRLMRGWNRYCGEVPNSFNVATWSRWPDAGLGVACGRGLLAFDIDRDDLVEPIKAVLPPAVVGKRGRKGETLFYRGDTGAIRSRGFKIDNLGVMDLIADGKQTVLPPSIHKTTGQPYVWTTERTLADTPLAGLTEVTKAHLDAVIEVLTGYGYCEAEQPHNFSCEIVDSGSAATEFFRRLNDDALANLDAWVPRLGLTRLQRQGDGYRSVAEWRPSNSGNSIGKRPLLLSINPKGIIDYGDGDRGYTPLNLVMAAHDLGGFQLDRAAVWLGECIGYDFAPKIVLNRGRASPAADGAAAYRAARDGEALAPVALMPEVRPDPLTAQPTQAVLPAEPESEAEVDESEPMTRSQAFEALATGLPGLVGDLVEWMAASALTPNRTLALAASLALVGTLAGRNYESPTGLRTNIYTLGLAPSGFGKDHARKCVNALLSKAGLDRWIAGSKIMSGSAMRKRVEAQPAIMWMIDEFGGFMAEINNKKNTHSYQIRDHLLEYFGSADGVFRGADYAGDMATPCYNPNVCLIGTSTPSDFWGACRSLSVADGLLPRFLIFTVGGDLPDEVRPTASKNEPPAPVVDLCRRLTSPKVGGNLANRTSDGSTKSVGLPVPFDAGAEEDYYALRERYRRLAFRASEDEAPFFNRLAEHAQKIAMILAIGVDPENPVIRSGYMDLGRQIAELCAAATINEISGRLADNDRQREHVDVKRWIIEAGADGITRTRLSKRVNGRFDRRRLDDILETLTLVSKEVDSVLFQNPRGGPKGARYVAQKFIHSDGLMPAANT